MATDPQALPTALVGQLERVIVGQRESITLILSSLLSGGHVLLEDRPGVGKTVLARAIARVLGLPHGRIQATPDLLPTDVTGVHIFQPDTGAWQFRPGPIFTSVLLVDELNRATPKAQSALLEAMAESQVTADGTTLSMPNPFMVIATQNPLGDAGTYPLGAAQTDRFATMVRLGLPGFEAERAVLFGTAGKAHLDSIPQVLNPQTVLQVMAHVQALSASPGIIDYVLMLVMQARDLDPNVWLSVRVSETLLGVARGHAFMSGRDYVAPEDVQAVAPAVLAHRLPSTLDGQVVQGLLERVPVPTNVG